VVDPAPTVDTHRRELFDFMLMLNNRLVLGAFGLRGDGGL